MSRNDPEPVDPLLPFALGLIIGLMVSWKTKAPPSVMDDFPNPQDFLIDEIFEETGYGSLATPFAPFDGMGNLLIENIVVLENDHDDSPKKIKKIVRKVLRRFNLYDPLREKEMYLTCRIPDPVPILKVLYHEPDGEVHYGAQILEMEETSFYHVEDQFRNIPFIFTGILTPGENFVFNEILAKLETFRINQTPLDFFPGGPCFVARTDNEPGYDGVLRASVATWKSVYPPIEFRECLGPEKPSLI